MGDMATDLGILEQVQSLVCDTLQVVCSVHLLGSVFNLAFRICGVVFP